MTASFQAMLRLMGVPLLLLVGADVSWAQSACRGPDGASTLMIGDTRKYTSTSDTAAVSMRRILGLPSVAASEVTLVTNTRTCQKAVDAMRASVTGGTQWLSDSVYVVAAGSKHFVVLDPEWGHSEPARWQFFVFDSKWIKLSVR